MKVRLLYDGSPQANSAARLLGALLDPLRIDAVEVMHVPVREEWSARREPSLELAAPGATDVAIEILEAAHLPVTRTSLDLYPPEEVVRTTAAAGYGLLATGAGKDRAHKLGGAFSTHLLRNNDTSTLIRAPVRRGPADSRSGRWRRGPRDSCDHECIEGHRRSACLLGHRLFGGRHARACAGPPYPALALGATAGEMGEPHGDREPRGTDRSRRRPVRS